MKFWTYAALPLVAALTACAAPDTDKASTAKAETCERDREVKTGSMLGRKQCGPALSEAERARMASELQTQIRPTASNPGSGGGH
ncbi:hypothetical protein [Mitsuaria sp. 7]|uniref:hypothetical protein n=1 Tax=Mitsuaria sp. 7 TaxID=1658665 RepID=UPI0007DCFC31|nr:hypothetical protein [Mitsuaria sp. 7]ANH66741.1 hypothetical protein ABE85_02650 [Mitsuaria sp. 7]